MPPDNGSPSQREFYEESSALRERVRGIEVTVDVLREQTDVQARLTAVETKIAMARFFVVGVVLPALTMLITAGVLVWRALGPMD